MTVETRTKPVRRMIRRRESSEYFKARGLPRKAAEAEKFSDILEAAAACSKHGLRNVELVLRTGTDVCDIFCTGLR